MTIKVNADFNAQVPITDANFQEAINTCLSTNPEDGMCSDSEYGAMPNWDVSNVTDMSEAFRDRGEFNADVSSWDVRSVTDMSYMFYGASAFNQDIGSWDVSSVTDMGGMFSEANAFNQDISNWCVSNISSEPNEFSLWASLTEENKPVWGSCPTASIDDQYFTNLSVFPNPVENSLFILGNDTPISVSIYNVLGKEVISIKNTNNINVQALPSGMYVIKISDGVGQTNRKFIKN